MSTTALSIVPTAQAPTLPLAITRYNASGKSLGTAQHFCGDKSAKDVKEALKAAGVKGKELTKRVNETLRGAKDLRQQLGMAWLQAQFQAGFVPDIGTMNKAGNKARIELVKPVSKVEITKDDVDAMSEEERAALIALLTQ